jgi:hypothetical protein
MIVLLDEVVDTMVVMGNHVEALRSQANPD